MRTTVRDLSLSPLTAPLRPRADAAGQASLRVPSPAVGLAWKKEDSVPEGQGQMNPDRKSVV